MPDIERGVVLAGRYQVEAVIGKGGSGVVLRAFDRTAQMVVAVKVLKPELTHDPRWSKRFARELRLGRPIRHPNVCRIFDISEGDGYRFLTMELATGGTLRDLVKSGAPLRPFPERLADARAAISGLAAIHEAGIVHRDVKPDNMLRMEDGRLALSDFGLATDLPTANAVTVMVGTPHYMAPEIRAGEPATTRSDVWALGVALFEIFFGRRPERKLGMSAEGYSRPPAPLTSTPVERAMLALCETCLADNPVERPSDARIVADLFETALSAPRRFRYGRRLPIIGATAIIAAVIGGFVVHRIRGHATADVHRQGIPAVEPIGSPADWTRAASPVVSVPGRIYCFSLIDERTALVVWGRPRRAEEVDILTGSRRPANLVPDAYAFGCPELSPTRRALLFTAQTVAGTTEIRMSTKPDGSQSISLTPGSEPVWMASGDQFLYNLDGQHPALFSLPTMTFILLADPELGGHQMIGELAASPTSRRLAVLFITEDAKYVATVYDGDNFGHHRSFLVPAARSIRFDPISDGILIPYNRSASSSTMTLLDWRRGTSHHLGWYPGAELLAVRFGGGEAVLLGRKRSKDVWLYDHGKRRRLTSDGQNYSAAMSSSGELLISKLRADGEMSIWRHRIDGTALRVTGGPDDVCPEFSADGRAWAYVDYARKSIMLCSSDNDRCSVAYLEENLPLWLRFSPDGSMLAYVTQAQTSQLMVLSVRERTVSPVAPVHRHCAPVWSSGTTLWALEGSAGHFSWVERRAIDGATTGKQSEFDGAPEGDECWPGIGNRDSPFLPRLRVETDETAQLLRIDAEELRRH